MTGSGITLAMALAPAATASANRLEAQLLLLHAMGRSPRERAWLLAHDDALLTPQQHAAFTALIARFTAGEPLAYITGLQAFYGLDLHVDARVLVPRSDTETLVDWVLERLDVRAVTRPAFIDLGTGSGAIACAVKHARHDVTVTAIDTSADALTVARANADRLGLEVTLHASAWLADVTGRFDVIAANPPYIATTDPHLPSLRHEPLQALASGVDGVFDLRQIIRQAPAHLQPGGWLLLEHGYDQAQRVRNLLIEAGFAQVQSRLDLGGIERCSGGHL